MPTASALMETQAVSPQKTTAPATMGTARDLHVCVMGVGQDQSVTQIWGAVSPPPVPTEGPATPSPLATTAPAPQVTQGPLAVRR